MQKWMEIDGKVIELAKKRAGLDYETGVVLLEAKRERVWEKIPFGSFDEYADRRFGWDGRELRERVRVALALEKMPIFARALQDGELSWSAVREVTRKAQPRNAEKWLAHAKGRTVRDLERLVSTLRPGDDPDATPDPSLRTFVVALEMKAEQYAKTVDILDLVKRDLGDVTISDAEANLVALQFWAEQHANAEPRSPYQIAILKNEDGRAFTTARGEEIELTPESAEKAECDAQVVSADQPVRACRTLPPSVKRFVRVRAHGKCEAPGCRNRFGLEDHHLTLWSEGGGHDPDNIVVLCSAHHDRFHDGTLLIEGTRAAGLVFKHADGSVYGQLTDAPRIQAFVDAYDALRAMGTKEKDARRVLAEVRALMPDAKAEEIVRVAVTRLAHVGRGVEDEAVSGLTNLGVKESEAKAAVAEVRARKPDAKVEEILKEALRARARVEPTAGIKATRDDKEWHSFGASLVFSAPAAALR